MSIFFSSLIDFFHLISTPFKQFLFNLKAGLYSFFVLKKSTEIGVFNIWQFLILLPIALFSNSLYSWIDTAGLGKFNVQGLVNYIIWPFIMLIIGFLIANRRNNLKLILMPVILWLVSDIYVTSLQ